MFNDIIKNHFMSDKEIVKDINGVEIKPGCLVLIHQMQETKKAVVVEVFPDNPTDSDFGYWIDVNAGNGIEGIMSYIIEVKTANKNVIESRKKTDILEDKCQKCEYLCAYCPEDMRGRNNV